MNILRFFRGVYGDHGRRIDASRQLVPDIARYAFNRALMVKERRLVNSHRVPGAPVIFIVGVPRSGTTLLYQLMARHLDVAYITNAVARYWLAPLWALQHRETEARIELRSDLGRSEGDAAPHEFGWFWQYHAPADGPHHQTESELDAFDWNFIAAELEAIAGWAGRPLVMKSLPAVDYHIPRFARELPGSVFVHIERDPRFTAQSLLESRRKRYGDEKTWWSIRPRDLDRWIDRDPVEQVAHQIEDISRHIKQGLATLPANRSMSLHYEQLIADPAKEMEKIARFVGSPILDTADLVSDRLSDGNTRRFPTARFSRIEAALRVEGLLR
jgi:hypothetical protein